MLFRSLVSAILCAALAVGAQAQVTVHDSQHNLTYTGYNHLGVENFQGIKYGQDTSGQNRFKHPQAYTYPTGTTVDATKAGPACPQNTSQTLGGFTENPGVYNMSEDCLNLRIARPPGTAASANLPVMVWIYGGGDEFGSTNYTTYDPTGLVLGSVLHGTPIVFVAMNYRTSVFGFANSQALRNEKSLNSGLMDQRLALQWVQNNIAAFGGNPKSVTLFGQSDGATGAGLHMTAYGGKGTVPFQRAIFESGGPSGDPGVSGNFTINSTNTIATMAGCPTGDSTQELSCLRGLSTDALLNAVLGYENISATPQDIFFPVIDGTYIPDAPSKLMRSGRFHKNIPIIAGFCYDDGSLFAPSTLSSAEEVQGYLQVAYPHLTAATLKTLISMYPVNQFSAEAKNAKVSPYFEQASRIYRDVNFACPAIEYAHRVTQYGSPSYLYELNRSALTPLLNTVLGAPYLGVFHISDVFYVFGEATTYDPTPTSARIQSNVIGTWTNFAKTGVPGGVNKLWNWTQAFTKSQAANTNAGVGQASVRVIGGPNAGQQEYMMKGQSIIPTEAQLLSRCAFINSANFYQQLQT